MDQDIYNKIVSYIRGMEDNLGSRFAFHPGRSDSCSRSQKK